MEMEKKHLLFLELEFNFVEKSCKIVQTNIKREMIDLFLEECVLSQICTGGDEKKATEQDIYHIIITCDLRGDVFSIRSDAGNKALTMGIISRIWADELWQN